MAHVTATSYPRSGIAGMLRTLVESAKRRSVERAAFAQTYRELSSLTDRDLADLGIHRSEIRRIAFEAAQTV